MVCITEDFEVNEKMNSSGKSKWEVVFNFSSPILEKSISDFEDFILDTEKVDEGIHFKGFSIITNALTIQEAFFYAQGKANRFFDYLSAVHKYPVECHMSTMIEVKPKGEVRTGFAFVTGKCVIHRPEILDFSKDNAKKILQNSDDKLVRQFSHYRRALKTDDIIEKIREYWLIIEDEYGKNHPFILNHLYIRHLVNHTELTRPNHENKAKNLLNKNYLDTSNPQDLDIIKNDFMLIQKEAKEIIDGKI